MIIWICIIIVKYKPFLLDLNHVETTITQRRKKLNIPSKIIREIVRFYFLILKFT